MGSGDTYTAVCDRAPGKGILIVGICLCHAQAHVSVIYYDKRVALSDRLIFLETYFLDVALHTAVDRYNLPLHLRVVGKLHIAKVDKLGCHPAAGCDDDGESDDIGEYLFSTVFHIFPEVNRSL